MTLTPVQQSAYSNIQTRLDEGTFSDVNEADLTAVRETLKGLSATDTDAVIDAMQGSGLLGRLAEESNDSEFLGMGQDGFDAGERKRLFDDLAGKLDGSSLAAVSTAFAGAETGEDDLDVVTDLAASVGQRATSQAKLDYIGALADSTDGSGISVRLNTSYGSATLTRHVDSEAAAIGTVLSTMSGPYAEAAFGRLSDTALANVLRTGVDENSSNAGTGGGSTFDSARFEGVLRAASTVGNSEAGIALKARVFDAAGERLGAVDDAGKGLGFYAENEDALTGMTASMTELLNTDTGGIMRQLTFDGSTAGGTAMTHYAESMIRTGQTEALADIVVDLQFGNGHNQNPVTHLDQVFRTSGGEELRENAGALGYFLGSVYAGAADRTSDVKAQQEEITGLLNFVAGKIPVAGGFSAGDGALGQDAIKKAVEMAIKDVGAAPAQRLELAAMPRDPNGRQIAGDDITTVFRTQLEAVRRAQE